MAASDPVDSSQRRDASRPYVRTMHNDGVLLTLEQAAEILGRSSDDVYQLIRRGDLLGIRIPDRGWFVHRDQVNQYIASRDGCRTPDT